MGYEKSGLDRFLTVCPAYAIIMISKVRKCSVVEEQKMRLEVKQKDGQAQEYIFHEDPIHIGRGASSQVVLADRTVSKSHAVIFSAEDGTWMVEDTPGRRQTNN